MMFHSAADAHATGAPIVRLFVTALARRPEAAELAPWVALHRAGTSLPTIAQRMTDAAEFLARHGPTGPSDRHYLRALCWAANGGDPDDDLAENLLNRPGATRASVLLAMSQHAIAHAGISLAANLYPDGLPPGDDIAYQLWLETLPQPNWPVITRYAATLPPVTVSLLLIVPPARPDLVAETLASLSAQIWPHWECLLICPAGLPPHVEATVAALARQVAGVRVLHVPASASSAEAANRGLAEATGSMVAWLEASDRLAPATLFEAAAALADQPSLRLIYTDEDSIAGDGTRTAALFKSDWSPDLALAGDCFGQVALMSRSSALSAGGFDGQSNPFERYDLALRLFQGSPKDAVRHLPKVLFHRGRLRDARPPPFPTARAIASQPALHAVVTRHLARAGSGLHLRERQQGNAFWPALDAPLPNPAPRVSIIVPTRDQVGLLERCLTGLLQETDYPDLEILVVDNGSTDGQALALLARIQHDPRVRVLAQPGTFNWSALNNAAAAEASGDILLLLNNDVEVLELGWLATMAAHALRPDVGVVGARLLFPDGTLQHGGVLLGHEGAAVHAMTHAAPGEAGYLGQVTLGRDVAAVTGACLAIHRAVFKEVGGLEQDRLRVAWSDIDLCLRVREAGYRVLWLPSATLTHHELATRGRDVSLQQQARHELERAVMRRRWPAAMTQDPLLNPNLDATATSIVLRPVAPQPDAEAPGRTEK